MNNYENNYVNDLFVDEIDVCTSSDRNMDQLSNKFNTITRFYFINKPKQHHSMKQFNNLNFIRSHII